MIDGKDEAWMAIPSYYLENVRGTFIFKCNYDVDLLNLSGLPEFYVDILKLANDLLLQNCLDRLMPFQTSGNKS